MTDSGTQRSLRLYFSFRSPFSWLALHRLEQTGAIPWSELEPIPIYPPNEEAVARVSGSPARRAYVREDAERIARAYGLEIRWPEAVDTDWPRPHAAFHWAQAEGAGQAFVSSLYRARFTRGEDVGADSALRDAAEEASLDPDAAVAAADDARWREKLLQGFARMQADQVFGVPTFVLDGERFWGNDRLEWVLRRLAERRGAAVPELATDLMTRPF